MNIEWYLWARNVDESVWEIIFFPHCYRLIAISIYYNVRIVNPNQFTWLFDNIILINLIGFYLVRNLIDFVSWLSQCLFLMKFIPAEYIYYSRCITDTTNANGQPTMNESQVYFIQTNHHILMNYALSQQPNFSSESVHFHVHSILLLDVFSQIYSLIYRYLKIGYMIFSSQKLSSQPF